MHSVIAQKNASLGTAASHSQAGPRWMLHEVLHGCLGQQPGNTFSFVIRLEGGTTREEKSFPPGY